MTWTVCVLSTQQVVIRPEVASDTFNLLFNILVHYQSHAMNHILMLVFLITLLCTLTCIDISVSCFAYNGCKFLGSVALICHWEEPLNTLRPLRGVV